MSTKKIITHRTPADGNIFADLGFAPEEAKRLLAEADQAIDEKRALKQMLMTEIVSWIDAHNLKAGTGCGDSRYHASSGVRCCQSENTKVHCRLLGGHGFTHG